ncbi:hypothetical protein SS1G_04493 [Sclerotinia sclerotiorum 1980 UF-70]|uniref:Uncharacterized protein n=1 Tax=Sclerotinia sclerotiorum (strain ATCC 18683 / 1980 / Ss-1) TaxID=665079 RepID=A7EGQ1_SCLS1|nr:hypothetical protein SS1G_04493 [Sclerotinia sclerotiorum 1980 UF-70]EDO02017.1 hypothetical protein SS1G_04493 [Sclerotinia sclerotiorum 1980 UF-70]
MNENLDDSTFKLYRNATLRTFTHNHKTILYFFLHRAADEPLIQRKCPSRPQTSQTEEKLQKLYTSNLELQQVQTLLHHGERPPTFTRFESSLEEPYRIKLNGPEFSSKPKPAGY